MTPLFLYVPFMLVIQCMLRISPGHHQSGCKTLLSRLQDLYHTMWSWTLNTLFVDMWTHCVWDMRTRVTILIHCTCQTHPHHPYVKLFLLILPQDVPRDLEGLWRDMAMDCDTTSLRGGMCDDCELWTHFLLIFVSLLCNHTCIYIVCTLILLSLYQSLYCHSFRCAWDACPPCHYTTAYFNHTTTFEAL